MWFGVNSLLNLNSAEKAKLMHHVYDRLKKKEVADVEKDPKHG